MEIFELAFCDDFVNRIGTSTDTTDGLDTSNACKH
jgi:hypothetical protein